MTKSYKCNDCNQYNDIPFCRNCEPNTIMIAKVLSHVFAWTVVVALAIYMFPS